MGKSISRGLWDDSDDGELHGAIIAFEQILQSIPNDRVAMEALWNMYEQLGDFEKGKHYLYRLARELARAGDVAAIHKIIDTVRSRAQGDSEGQSIVAQLSEFD